MNRSGQCFLNWRILMMESDNRCWIVTEVYFRLLQYHVTGFAVHICRMVLLYSTKSLLVFSFKRHTGSCDILFPPSEQIVATPVHRTLKLLNVCHWSVAELVLCDRFVRRCATGVRHDKALLPRHHVGTWWTDHWRVAGAYKSYSCLL